jgi:hypothetical protein
MKDSRPRIHAPETRLHHPLWTTYRVLRRRSEHARTKVTIGHSVESQLKLCLSRNHGDENTLIRRTLVEMRPAL